MTVFYNSSWEHDSQVTLKWCAVSWEYLTNSGQIHKCLNLRHLQHGQRYTLYWWKGCVISSLQLSYSVAYLWKITLSQNFCSWGTLDIHFCTTQYLLIRTASALTNPPIPVGFCIFYVGHHGFSCPLSVNLGVFSWKCLKNSGPNNKCTSLPRFHDAYSYTLYAWNGCVNSSPSSWHLYGTLLCCVPSVIAKFVQLSFYIFVLPSSYRFAHAFTNLPEPHRRPHIALNMCGKSTQQFCHVMNTKTLT